jgi:hypothetical protein
MTASPRLASVRPLPGARIDARLWITLAWAGVVVFALALGALAGLGRWAELRMAAGFFGPLLPVMLVRHGLPSLLVAAIVACTLVSAAGWAWDWYARLWWFDIVLHTVNPLVMMAASMFMLWKADLLAHAPRKGRFVLWATGLGLALGVGWEILEFTYLPLTWPDTILDLVMDGAGAALGGWLAIWLIEQRGEPPAGRRYFRRGGFGGRRIPLPARAPRRGEPR